MTSTSIPPPSPSADELGTLIRREQTLASRPPSRRRYAIASFDNLVVLANYEEHLREARRMVWRDRGEPAVEVHDLWECLEHGFRGGLRTSPSQLSLVLKAELSLFAGAGTLAFAIRSGVNLILLFARVRGFRQVSRCAQGCS
jgi:hypothetical protein